MSIPIWNDFIIAIEQALRFLDSFLRVVPGHAGLTIILFTIIVKAALMPLTIQSLRSSRAMQELQPKIKDLQKKYAKDKEKLSQETMKLYKEHRVNPVGGCLPMILQLPIFFALYGAILNLSNGDPAFAAPFLWLSSLAKPDPLYILPFLAVVTQFVQQRMMMSKAAMSDPQQATMNRMMQFMPLMIGVFAFNFPSGAVLYWVTSSVFSVVQQYFITGWGTLPDLLKYIGRPSNGDGRAPVKKGRTSGNGAASKGLFGGGLGNLLAAPKTENKVAKNVLVESAENGDEQKAVQEVYNQVALKKPKKKRSKR